MAQTRFAVRHTPTSGSNVIVYQETAGSLVQIGNPIDTSIGGGVIDVAGAPGADDDKTRHSNLAVKFLGGVYCYVSNAVWKLDRGTGNWAAVQINSPNQQQYYHHTGLYVAPGPTGTPRMFGVFFNDSGNTHNSIHTDDGAAWVATVGPVGSTGYGGATRYTPVSEIIFRGQLFFVFTLRSTDSDKIVSFDPTTLGFAFYDPVAGATPHGPWGATFVNFKDRLFMAYPNMSGTRNLRMLEFVGGAFINLTDLSTIFSVAAGDIATDWQWRDVENPYEGMPVAVLYDPSIVDALIFILYFSSGTKTSASDRGGRAGVYDPDAVVATQDLTNILIPPAWRYPSAGATADEEVHLEATVDNVEVPGSIMNQVRFGVAKVSALEVYSLSTIAGLLTSQGTGANYQDFAWSVSKDGGGERIFQDLTTEYDVVESGPRIPIIGGTRVVFKLYSDPADGAATHTLQARFSEGGAAPVPLVNPGATGKISGPAAAPTLLGSTVQGLTADNGATEYYLDFLGPSQGVLNGERHKLILLLTA